MNPLSHIHDRALGGNAHDLRQPERRRSLHDGGDAHGGGDRNQEIRPLLADHVVDQELGAPRQDQARQTIEDHQDQSDPHLPAMRPHQFPGLAPHHGRVQGSLLGFLHTLLPCTKQYRHYGRTRAA